MARTYLTIPEDRLEDVAPEVRRIRLPDQFYKPRRTLGGGIVRDAMPYEGALAYVTDGERYGVLYNDWSVDWLGDSPEAAFGDGAEIINED